MAPPGGIQLNVLGFPVICVFLFETRLFPTDLNQVKLLARSSNTSKQEQGNYDESSF
jgi:hypothetical protein